MCPRLKENDVRRFVTRGTGNQMANNKSLKDMLDDLLTKLTWQVQPIVIVDESPPVLGQKYTLLDTTENVFILNIHGNVTWTDQPTPLELHYTIDEITETAQLANPNSGANYFMTRPSHTTTLFQWSSTDFSKYGLGLVQARSVKIEVEITGGTVSRLKSNLKYAKRV